jgi:phosphoribosylpyrophosphate synthetase
MPTQAAMPLIAEAIKRVQMKVSVSTLFDVKKE